MASRITISYEDLRGRYAAAAEQQAEEFRVREQVGERAEALDQDEKAASGRLYTDGPTQRVTSSNMSELEAIDRYRRDQLLRENPGAFTRTQRAQVAPVLVPQARPGQRLYLVENQPGTVAPVSRVQNGPHMSIRVDVNPSGRRQTAPSAEKKT